MTMFNRALLSLLVIFTAAPVLNAADMKNGSVFKQDGAQGLYYYINGYAAHIPSPAVLQCMGLEKKKINTISKQQIDAMPKTAFLIRGSDSRVYRVDGNSKRHVPNPAVFKKLGFNQSEIIPVSETTIQCIQEGPPLQ